MKVGGPLMLSLGGALLLTWAMAVRSDLRPFVPHGSNVFQVQRVDLDGDGHPDRVLILEDLQQDSTPRTLVLLRDTPEGLTEMTRSSRILPCRNCGGAYGDPLENVYFRDGQLQVIVAGKDRRAVVRYKLNTAPAWTLSALP